MKTSNDRKTINDIQKRIEHHGNVKAIVFSELLFVLFPFIVIGVVFSYEGNLKKLFFSSEWALAASLLSGQTIVKFVSGIINRDSRYHGRISLLITSIIVLLFVPSLLVLTLILVSEINLLGLAITQIILFILSVIVFYVYGGLGIHLREESKDT